MSTTVADTPSPTLAMSLDGYQLRLPAFAGPLDVLLRLVERDQLPIAEVSLVAVTDQFIAYLADLGDISPETVADFAAVGARLVLLKTRSLLPRAVADEHVDLDEDDLVRQLSEYQQIRTAAWALAERERLGAGAFASGRGVAVPEPVAPPLLAAHQPSMLARALRRRLTALAPPVHLLPRRPAVTLRQVIDRILGRLATVRTIRFEDLLTPGADRSDVLTSFLAVLALVRRRVLDADQLELFGAITISRATTAAGARLASDAVRHELAADD